MIISTGKACVAWRKHIRSFVWKQLAALIFWLLFDQAKSNRTESFSMFRRSPFDHDYSTKFINFVCSLSLFGTCPKRDKKPSTDAKWKLVYPDYCVQFQTKIVGLHCMNDPLTATTIISHHPWTARAQGNSVFIVDIDNRNYHYYGAGEASKCFCNKTRMSFVRKDWQAIHEFQDFEYY